ncbi:MAG: WYL domain-containing protein [Clostridia bacterium]|nr:WYL domain-containing protein [Clostridia bacterium]
MLVGFNKITLEPYSLIYVDNNYYLLAFDNHGKKRHFCVDRMEDVRIHTWSFSMEKINAKVDLENYTKYTFSMYGKGDVVRVTMRFDNNLVSMVLDRFGHDVMLVKDDETHFTITEPIAVSPQFFAWIFALGEKAEIVGPVEVRDQMRKMMEKRLKAYTGK